MPFTHEGPALEALQHRLADLPADFLAAPATTALLHDLLRQRGAAPDGAQLAAWQRQTRGEAPLLPVLCWLLAAPEFDALAPDPDALWRLLTDTGAQLAALAPVRKYLADPDRREELLRIALADLDLRPAGETAAQAQDRLSSISSIERARVLQAARATEARAREIREALARKAAQEGADKWARE